MMKKRHLKTNTKEKDMNLKKKKKYILT